jgi:DNA-binding CsgD family transcriptional regulator
MMSQDGHMTGVRTSDHTLDRLLSLLTQREYEIAQLIAHGLSNYQIAERLVVSPGTVANHVAHVLSKLDSDSRVQVAVKMAMYQSRTQSEPILTLLERLREIRQASLQEALQHATDVLASTFAADKVDAFLVDPRRDLLVAVGTSQTRWASDSTSSAWTGFRSPAADAPPGSSTRGGLFSAATSSWTTWSCRVSATSWASGR